MVTPGRDIYEVLGIDPGASTALAREIYWRRVGGFLEADRAGDPAARAAIDELNEALAIVMDRTLRADYDSRRKAGGVMRPHTTIPVDETVVRRGYRRSVMIVLLIPILGVAIAAAFQYGTLIIGIAAIFAALVVFLLSARWATSEAVQGQSPFHVLMVGEDATIDELDTAYENQVHVILLNVRSDPRALQRLELLDEAYVRACTIVAEGESGLTSRRKLKPMDWLGLQAEHAGAGIFHLIQRGSLGFLRLVLSAIGWLGRGLAGGAAAIGRKIGSSGEAPEAEATETAQVERRLAATFRGIAERTASTSAASGHAADAVPLLDAALILHSRAGDRRVAIGSAPIRIGSADHADVVLREPGVVGEHAIVWQRGDLLLLHVVSQDAACLVNGRPMMWATLENGDEIKLGKATVHVEVRG